MPGGRRLGPVLMQGDPIVLLRQGAQPSANRLPAAESTRFPASTSSDARYAEGPGIEFNAYVSSALDDHGRRLPGLSDSGDVEARRLVVQPQGCDAVTPWRH
jgi:hypothetical protein